jgi:class 3 adenylate cyclase
MMPEDAGTSPTRSLERKLATILSADVAEYSRLMAEDEEGTLRTFRAHKEVFDQLVSLHRGRVFNTAGDAILAEFTSAVEAVRCATEIQAALRTRNDQLPPSRQVRFRIGVNLGDVMVQGSDLLGDGVNVAARLQGAAEPGGVCVSGSVYDQIRNKLSLTFKSLGEQSFKNIPQPVRTFSITESETDGVFPSPPAVRRGGAGRGVMALAAAALLLLVIGGGYWGYGEWQRGKAEQARLLAEAEAARQEEARRDAQITAERARAEQLLRAAEADKKRAEDEAQRAREELRKKEAATRPVAAAQPPPQQSPASAAPRAPGAVSLDGLYAGPLCYGPTATNDQPRCYRAQAFVADGKITGRWSYRNSSATTFLSGSVSAAGDVQIEIYSASADKPRRYTINLAGSLRDGRPDATGTFVSGRSANLHWLRQ